MIEILNTSGSLEDVHSKIEKIVTPNQIPLSRHAKVLMREFIYSMISAIFFTMMVWFIFFSFMYFINKDIFFFTRNTFLMVGIVFGLIAAFGEKSRCPIVRGLQIV